MQAALCCTPTSLPLARPIKSLASPLRSISAPQTSHVVPIKATAEADETSIVDYGSKASVFPAEACETIGGDACEVEMYPEVKLKPKLRKKMPKTSSESTEREYLEYNDLKTVFPGEACDDLGGEFCEPEYQSGVY